MAADSSFLVGEEESSSFEVGGSSMSILASGAAEGGTEEGLSSAGSGGLASVSVS